MHAYNTPRQLIDVFDPALSCPPKSVVDMTTGHGQLGKNENIHRIILLGMMKGRHLCVFYCPITPVISVTVRESKRVEIAHFKWL